MTATAEKYGAQNDKETEATRKAAERPVDQDPLFAQLKEQMQQTKAENTRLAARNVDLEHTNKLLEGESSRFAILAVRGGLSISSAVQMHAKIPMLYDEELQDLVFECNEEMKRRAEKRDSKRKTERRKVIEKSANGNGKRV